MKIIIYTSHPSQFLFFKVTIRNLLRNGHQIKLLIRSKDILEDLVKHEGFHYSNILIEGRQKSNISISLALIKRLVRLNRICRKFKPDLMIGTDASLAQIGFLRRIPVITTLEDDINVIPMLARLTFPFTNYIFAPECCNVGQYKKKKIAYEGFMKLAYLHPNHFVPDRSIVQSYIDSEKYSLIRLSALNAHHDFNEYGISNTFLKILIDKLLEVGNVYISSEKTLPKDFQIYALKINPSHLHHLLFYSEILISDSQSMSVEAAILETPSIRISSFTGRISILEELEHKYKLTFGFKPDNYRGILSKLNELISSAKNHVSSSQLILDKIDVASFLSWIIENYPGSVERYFLDPSIQFRFK